jgi:hypothetical protein
MSLRQAQGKLFVRHGGLSDDTVKGEVLWLSADLRWPGENLAEIVALAAELAEVVVGVQPSPAHPFSVGERAEERVAGASDMRAVETGELMPGVESGGGEVSGEDAEGALIDFGMRGDVLRPGARDPERRPFEGAPAQAAVRRGRDFAERDSDGAADVAKHLVDVHAAPAGGVGWGDGGEAEVECAVVRVAGQGVHGGYLIRFMRRILLADGCGEG